MKFYRNNREKHVKIVKNLHQNGTHLQNTFRALRNFFGQHNRPNFPTIGRSVDKALVWYCIIIHLLRTGSSTENIAAVMAEQQRTSVHQRAQEFCMST